MSTHRTRHGRTLRRQIGIATGAAALVALGIAAPTFAATPTAWSRTATIVGARAEQGLGATTVISADGSTLFVGGNRPTIYTRSGSHWVPRTFLPAAVGALGMSANGNTVAFGEPSVPIGTTGASGRVLVYVRRGNSWVRQSTIADPNPEEWDFFGRTISISADGNTLLTSSSFSQLDPEAGDMFYVRSGSTWKLAQTIGQPIGGLTAFGGGVLSGDGKTALLTWTIELSPADEISPVATFVRSGTTWSEQGPLISDPVGSSPAALSFDGTTAVLTSQSSGLSYQALQIGRVLLYTRSGTTWALQQVISVPGTTGTDFSYPTSVAISSDARTVLVGSRTQFAGRGTGAIYTEQGGAWVQTAMLPAPGTEKTESQTGVAAALSGNGKTAVLGEAGANNYAGAVGVYSLHAVLTHAQWAWLHSVYIPAHYAPALRARAWTILTSNPDAALAIIERYGPSSLH